jgi:membrane-bound metal-dependent hydrolase YbcI (DUF457 family)
MGSPLGHGLVGVGLALAASQITGARNPLVLCAGAAIAGNLPDLDLLLLATGQTVAEVHRQATHSLVVLGGLSVLGVAVWIVVTRRRPPKETVPWALALLAHPLLDVQTTSQVGGGGIPLLWPIDSSRWGVPQPIYYSPALEAYRQPLEVWRYLLPEFLTLAPMLAALIVLGAILGNVIRSPRPR